VKKFLPFIFLAAGLLGGGCAGSIPIYPILFMLMKDDQPVPTPTTPDTLNAPTPSAAPTGPGKDQDTATG
jgi:hypothetical protein